MLLRFLVALVVGVVPLAAQDRKGLPVEKALLGTWFKTPGHAAWFYGPGKVAISDEGIAIRGKWETLEKDEQAGTLRIKVTDFDLGDQEQLFTFAADRKSLTMSCRFLSEGPNAKFHFAQKWVYEGSAADPEPRRPAEAYIPFDAKQARAHQEAWGKYWGVPAETTNCIGMKLAFIPAGRYKPPAPGKGELRNLRLQFFPYYIGVTEVTRRQFQAVMGETAASKGTDMESSLPMIDVAWQDAIAFCNKLSAKEGLEPAYSASGEWRGGVGYRVPDEQEWEFACRAGATTAYWFGDDPALLKDHAWYSQNSQNQLNPVGEKTANPFGLFDMYGNAAEWCEIVTEESPFRSRSYLARGGQFRSDAAACRSANRNEIMRATDKSGFRVVRWPGKVERP